MQEERFSDAQVDAAIEALTQPDRFREAEARVARIAPQLQRILNQALNEGGWLDDARDSHMKDALASGDEQQQRAALRTLLAEETQMGMLVGVAVGWELARELELNDEKEND